MSKYSDAHTLIKTSSGSSVKTDIGQALSLHKGLLIGLGIGASGGALFAKFDPRIRPAKDAKTPEERRKSVEERRRRAMLIRGISSGIFYGLLGHQFDRIGARQAANDRWREEQSKYWKNYEQKTEDWWSRYKNQYRHKNQYRGEGSFAGRTQRNASDIWKDLGGVGEPPKTKAEFKTAYRAAAMKYHPDRNPDPSAADKFRTAAKAWEDAEKSEWFSKLASFPSLRMGLSKLSSVATKTDPQKWEAAKAEAKAKMGGKHSARAMQLATQIYKKKGGGYSGSKPTSSTNSLKKWTKQDWNWTGGDKPGQGGRGVYLPKQKADRLRKTEEGKDQLAAAARKKREATRKGEQYSSHGLAANTSLRKK